MDKRNKENEFPEILPLRFFHLPASIRDTERTSGTVEVQISLWVITHSDDIRLLPAVLVLGFVVWLY
jgi:hypothetical protein